MRKFLVISLLLFLTLGISAQTYDEFSDAFESFAEASASALPFNSLVGLNWSDAYIGNFPHFGVGLTLGMTTMPFAGIKKAMDALGQDSGTLPDIVKSMGVPIPAFMVEGRIGGFILPFDIGIKIGALPENFEIPDVGSMNYFLAGFDVRYSLLKNSMVVIPAVSVGGGLNYLKGGVKVPGVLGSNITLLNFGPYNLELTDPDFTLDWETLTFDLKAEASWSLLILNAYVGTGLSYGIIAKAGGGMESKIINQGTAAELTQAEIDAILAATGEELDLTDQGVTYTANVPSAWSMRLFAGVSVNLLILKLDLSAMYNLFDGAFGLGLNGRIQI